MIEPKPDTRQNRILTKLKTIAQYETTPDSILYYLLSAYAEQTASLYEEEHFPQLFHKRFRQVDPVDVPGINQAIYDAIAISTKFWNIVHEVLKNEPDEGFKFAESDLPEKVKAMNQPGRVEDEGRTLDRKPFSEIQKKKN